MADPVRLKPSYPGEDTRPTSKKEVWGWYSYGWAAEVFVVCGVGSFIPITLEQLARERGTLLHSPGQSCSPKLPLPGAPGVNSTTSGMSDQFISLATKTNPCVIYFLGRPINTASFAMYTFSVSVLIQALLIVSMSGAADHGRFRKTLLLIFATTGAVATMAFLPVTAPFYYVGAFLAIIANTCFGASFVLLNSFLPLLVRNHPDILALHLGAAGEADDATATGRDSYQHGTRARPSTDPHTQPLLADDDSLYTEGSDEGQRARQRQPLLQQNSNGEEGQEYDTTAPFPRTAASTSPDLRLSAKISSTGIGIGYIAAVIVQILSVLMVRQTGGSTFSLRLVLFFVGAWWLVFSIPSAIYLRARPGPPLQSTSKQSSLRTGWSYVASSWVRLYQTFHRARALKDVILFLAGWFLLSDAIATVSGTAVLFAKTTLNMSAAALALINVVVMVSGVLGAFVWPMLPLAPSRTILAALAIFELIPLYAILGYIPAVQRWGVLGLQQSWEMYLLAFFYGLVLGGISSYCRAVFGDLIPPGSEAAFYALYAITDKGSSVFGPAVVGLITDRYGEIRPAFVFLALLIAAPFPLMALVDVDRGKREGRALARELQLRAAAATATATSASSDASTTVYTALDGDHVRYADGQDDHNGSDNTGRHASPP